MIKENAIHRLLLFRHRKGNTELLNESLDMAIEALRQPERETGEWIDKSNGIEGAWNYCSVCGEQAIDLYDFCPNCGADMRGNKHEVN